MSGPFDINGLGGNYFTSAQSGLVLNGSFAFYSPAFTSSAINISSVLTQMCDLDVPSGKTRILLAATLTGLNSGGAVVDAEIEVDGVTILTAATNIAGTSVYLVGGVAGSIQSNTVSAIQVNRNLKIRAKKALSTAAVLTLWYIDRA